MFTHAFAVAIHHRIVDSGQSKNPANWQESRLVGCARRHSSFAASGQWKAQRSRTAGARSPSAVGFRTEAAQMKKLIIPALALTVVQSTALAAPGTASGPNALALAAVIAQHSPAVRAFDKRVIARLFRGNTRFGFTPNTKISVDAESVVCRVSNVDITSRSCELNFGARKRTLTGREANEVGATMAAAGIPSEGAAGSSIESVSKLRCSIDPNEIMQKAGGGAQCSFETGQ
jgi:hypothetical protein